MKLRVVGCAVLAIVMAAGIWVAAPTVAAADDAIPLCVNVKQETFRDLIQRANAGTPVVQELVGSGENCRVEVTRILPNLTGSLTLTISKGQHITLARTTRIRSMFSVSGSGKLDLTGFGIDGQLSKNAGVSMSIENIGKTRLADTKITDTNISNNGFGAELTLVDTTIKSSGFKNDSRNRMVLSRSTMTHSRHIFNLGALLIDQSTISDNPDGAIVNWGILTVDKSLIQRNTVTLAKGRKNPAFGAGIFSAANGTVTISDSVITGNRCINEDPNSSLQCGGGGIYQHDGRITISDTTIANNEATNGGGIYIGNPEKIRMNDAKTYLSGIVNVIGNTATKSNAGGIYRASGEFTISKKNTTVTISNNKPKNCNGACPK